MQMVPSVEATLATLPSVVVLVAALLLGISIFGAQVRIAGKFTNTYILHTCKSEVKCSRLIF